MNTSKVTTDEMRANVAYLVLVADYFNPRMFVPSIDEGDRQDWNISLFLSDQNSALKGKLPHLRYDAEQLKKAANEQKKLQQVHYFFDHALEPESVQEKIIKEILLNRISELSLIAAIAQSVLNGNDNNTNQLMARLHVQPTTENALRAYSKFSLKPKHYAVANRGAKYDATTAQEYLADKINERYAHTEHFINEIQGLLNTINKRKNVTTLDELFAIEVEGCLRQRINAYDLMHKLTASTPLQPLTKLLAVSNCGHFARQARLYAAIREQHRLHKYSREYDLAVCRVIACHQARGTYDPSEEADTNRFHTISVMIYQHLLREDVKAERAADITWNIMAETYAGCTDLAHANRQSYSCAMATCRLPDDCSSYDEPLKHEDFCSMTELELKQLEAAGIKLEPLYP